MQRSKKIGPISSRKNNQETRPRNDTELADKEVKRPIIKIPHKLKKVEEKMNIMKEEMKDVRNKLNF